jgi:pyruvate dehydrogenase E2 component (dihydrolipoamide acetyltransferase)
MAELIRMPRMSDTMTEAVIVAWHKKVGDKVKPGDVLAEVETDKATMELESYNEGTLLFIGVDQGKSVQVDGVLAVVGKPGEDFKALLDAAQKKAADMPSKSTEAKPAEIKPAEAKPIEAKSAEIKPAAIEKAPTATETETASTVTLPKGAKEIRMPLLSDTMTEGKILSWQKKVGDKVKADDVLCEVETDKATMEVVGYEEGTLLYTGVEAGQAARVNDIIAIVGQPGTDVSSYVEAEKRKSTATVPATASAPQPAQPAAVASQPVVMAQVTTAPDIKSDNGRVKISPLARKLASEKGIELNSISGSGDGGRIIKRDVDNYIPSGAKLPPFTPVTSESYTDIPLSQMRKTIARRLAESKFSAPHFYLTMEINMDNAMSVRESINEIAPVKVSFNDFI